MEDHLDDSPPPTYAEVLKEKSRKEQEEEEQNSSLAHPQRVYIDRVFTSDGRRDSASSRYTYSNTKIRYLM